MVATTNQTKPLAAFKEGEAGIIAGFSNDQLASKLIAMGILPGARLQLVRKAPFGGAYYVASGNFRVALRKSEAAGVLLS